MKNKIQFKLAILLFLSALFISFGVISVCSYKSANADSLDASLEFFTPITETEYYNLSNPIDFFYNNEVFAVIQGDEKIIIKGSYNSYKDFDLTIDAISLSQIKYLNENSLLISDNGSINKFSLSDTDPKGYTYEGWSYGSSNKNVGGNFFDIFGNHLVSVFQSTATVYTLSDFEVIDDSIQFSANGNFPIAINENGDVFYIVNSTLTKRNLNNVSISYDLCSNANPKKMIADNEYIYYVDNSNKIYKLSVNGGTPIELTTENNLGFELGSIVSPIGLCFKDGNLLISDSSLNAVSEFIVDGDKLIFTGFAIAKGATAYNRIGLESKKVDSSNGKVAVLDNEKLTVINSDTTDYLKENYINYVFPTDTQGAKLFNADTFALGNNTALFVNKNSYKIQLLDLDTLSVSEEKVLKEEDVTQTIADANYLGGSYYVLKVITLSNKKVLVMYSINEKDFTSSPTKLFTFTPENSSEYELFNSTSIFTTDVFGNFYISGTDGYLYRFYKSENGYEKEKTNYQVSLSGERVLLELSSDLTGTIYALYKDKIDYFAYSNTYSVSIDAKINNAIIPIKSFAMNFDEKSVYFVLEGEGVLMKTTTLPNVAVSNLTIPSDYVITSDNADVANLKFYSAKEGAISYIVTKEDGKTEFSYSEIFNPKVEDDFVYICSIFVSPTGIQDKTELLVLAGKRTVTDEFNQMIEEDITILLNKFDIADSDVEVLDVNEEKAFIATGVSTYYLPIMTTTGTYCLTESLTTIRLEKSTEINPIKELTFLGKAYYYAQFEFNGNTHFGYIPKDFTVAKLYENSEQRSYKIEKVEKTYVYSDIDLTNKVFSLEDGDEIRVYSEEDGVAFIGYKVGDNWVDGYVSASVIKKAPNTVIRNILIFLCVAIAVCATSVYFILRKR